MNPPPLQQLRDEALTMLVLWAASRDYSPDIEQLLKLFAKTFEIPESELTERLIQAADGKLTRPDANAYDVDMLVRRSKLPWSMTTTHQQAPWQLDSCAGAVAQLVLL
eukprot:gene5976-6215_t